MIWPLTVTTGPAQMSYDIRGLARPVAGLGARVEPRHGPAK
jgi:hypothetical protein